MKTIIGIGLAFVSLLPVFGAEPALTEAQVSEIGGHILDQSRYAPYREYFRVAGPSYDAEEGVWRFQGTGKGASFPGSGVFFFELRDVDGHYRIGHISGSGYHPKSSEKFRMSPSLRKVIAAVMAK